MKQFLNLSSLFIVALFAGNLFFISCQDENNDPDKPSKPLLATMSSYSKDGTMEESESYRYDANGRLIEMLNSDDYKVLLEYSATTLTMKEYDKDELSYSSIFNLNDKGLYISSPSNDYKTTTFTYDTNGYRQSMVELSDNLTIKQTFTVSNENYVTITTESNFQPNGSAKVKSNGLFERSQLLKSRAMRIATHNMLKSASTASQIDKTDFVFYTDKINTIEYENMGIYFFGKQNKNPIKQELSTFPLNGEIYTSASYTYEYDTKGRITKQIEENGNYNVYTYID